MNRPLELTRSLAFRAGILATVGLLWTLHAAAQAPPTDPLTLLNNRPHADDAAATQPVTDPLELQRRLLEPHSTDVAAAQAARLAQDLTDEQVRAAIKRGGDYLLQRLLPNGKLAFILPGEQRPWIGFAGDQSIGLAALCAYALIETGRTTGDPRLRPFSPETDALAQWLITAHAKRTYSAALQASALALLPQRPEVKSALARIRNDLILGMHDDGTFGYVLKPPNSYWDNSNTQYALLGLWAISDTGLETPQHFWRIADAHWRQTQSPAGGWAYQTPVTGFILDPGATLRVTPRPSLTVAGVASLFVTLDHLDGGERQPSQDRALQLGMAAVGADFAANLNTLGDNLYYTYGVQRVGAASGLKYINRINWYRRGAAALLLSENHTDGAWSYGYSKLAGTAYALLFLTHGGSPIVFNKLQYPGNWNASPRDDANLTRRITHTLELPLNWQIVSLDSDPAEWLDAPVLLITGDADPHFTAADLQKLRTFIHAGGIVFSIADGNDEIFTAAVRRDAALVCGDQYPMRQLPADHPLFTLYEKVKDPPALLGISNGDRELWIHSPVDFAASWQHFAYSEKDHWTIPINLFLYATGRGHPRSRLDALAVRAGAQPPEARIALARLAYAGHSDPEPGAWPRLAKLLQRDINIQLDLQTVDVAALDARQTPIAHLTGNEHFTLDDAAVRRLRDFLQRGGTLLADSTGGSETFTDSFLALARALAPDSQIDILPPDHALLDGRIPGSIKIDGDHTEFRKATPLNRRAGGRAEIWAWKVNGRDAILFSPLDITSGLLGTDTWGISGYSPDCSQNLARDLVLYAATAPPITPSTLPATPQTASTRPSPP